MHLISSFKFGFGNNQLSDDVCLIFQHSAVQRREPFLKVARGQCGAIGKSAATKRREGRRGGHKIRARKFAHTCASKHAPFPETAKLFNMPLSVHWWVSTYYLCQIRISSFSLKHFSNSELRLLILESSNVSAEFVSSETWIFNVKLRRNVL